MDNLEKLQKIVLEQAEAKARQIDMYTQKLLRERYEQNKKTVDAQVAQTTTVAQQELKAELRQQLIQKRSEYRRQLLSTRQRYTDDIFQEVTKQLIAAKGSPIYAQYLHNSFKTAVEQLGGFDIIYAAPQDIEAVKKAIGQDNVLADNGIQIGGIIVQKGCRAINATFDEKLRQEREQFASNGIFSLQ